MYKRSFGIRCSVSSEIRVKALIYGKISVCDVKVVVLESYVSNYAVTVIFVIFLRI